MMESDRELLEDAARAAGYKIHGDCGDGALWVHPEGAVLDHYGELPIVKFNPLTDDGDALRLAVKLGLLVDCKTYGAYVTDGSSGCDISERGKDVPAATRRAIVLAAASIGRASPAVGGGE